MTPAVSRFPHRFPQRPNWAEERGVALVEFALVLPILLVLLFGMLDFGRAFNYWIDSTHLANEGARWAVVNKNPASAGDAAGLHPRPGGHERAPQRRHASVPDGLEVCITFPSGATVGQPGPCDGQRRRTTGSHSSSDQALGGVDSTTVSSSSTMRLEAIPTNYGAGCS